MIYKYLLSYDMFDILILYIYILVLDTRSGKARSIDEEPDTPSTINPSVAMAVAGNQFGPKPPPLALSSVVSIVVM